MTHFNPGFNPGLLKNRGGGLPDTIILTRMADDDKPRYNLKPIGKRHLGRDVSERFMLDWNKDDWILFGFGVFALVTGAAGAVGLWL